MEPTFTIRPPPRRIKGRNAWIIATGANRLTSSCMRKSARMILAGISMEYLKKARGQLTAECTGPIPGSERKEYDNVVEIRDSKGELVARGHVRSLVGPKTASKDAAAKSAA